MCSRRSIAEPSYTNSIGPTRLLAGGARSNAGPKQEGGTSAKPRSMTTDEQGCVDSGCATHKAPARMNSAPVALYTLASTCTSAAFGNTLF